MSGLIKATSEASLGFQSLLHLYLSQGDATVLSTQSPDQGQVVDQKRIMLELHFELELHLEQVGVCAHYAVHVLVESIHQLADVSRPEAGGHIVMVELVGESPGSLEDVAREQVLLIPVPVQQSCRLLKDPLVTIAIVHTVHHGAVLWRGRTRAVDYNTAGVLTQL